MYKKKATSKKETSQVNPYSLPGLSTEEVKQIRIRYGTELILQEPPHPAWTILREIVTEPMFLLLVAAASVYFISGESTEGFFMLGAIALISAISWYQSARAQQALDALNAYTAVKVKVIRDNLLKEIPQEELVPGDFVVVSEGDLIPVDGQLEIINDFTVNESILTGEAYAVDKHLDKGEEARTVYRGTLSLSGQAVVLATATGPQTRIHQMGRAIDTLEQQKSILNLQIDQFVQRMAILGTAVFLLILLVDYLRNQVFLESLLKGLTIAMSVLPEEIPVAFTVFLALGAFRMAQKGIIVKRANTTEALGSVNVLCLDKTGTITENRMELKSVYVFKEDELVAPEMATSEAAKELISTAMWASEPAPFDPMEIALHAAYQKLVDKDLRTQFDMIHEYPLSGHPPMMTHVHSDDAVPKIIAVKGAPSAVLASSDLKASEKEKIWEKIALLSKQGLRVLGVGLVEQIPVPLPKDQKDFNFIFQGLVGFYDPPKSGVEATFKDLYHAGIDLKIITGDSVSTTMAIARQSNFKFKKQPITGKELDALPKEEWEKRVLEREIFCRITPEQKLRIIQCLKDQNLIIGMTGDGVNDGLALKAAHIGIAMGKKGTEIARRAASLILVDGNIKAITEAVAIGRRIYDNLKKAIQYIISIHIPIILVVAIPVLWDWRFAAIFSPVHVIFLELIMGPTCSIVYENEPMEANTMDRPPRALGATFFAWRELFTSIIQGLAITVGILGVYKYALWQGMGETETRSLVFLSLLIANIFLTLVNRSFYYSIFTTLAYKNHRMLWIIGITLLLTVCLFVIPPLANLFGIGLLSWPQLGMAICVGMISSIWFEGVKYWIRIRK